MGMVLAGCVGVIVTLFVTAPVRQSERMVVLVNNTPCFVCHIPPLLTYRAYSDYWEQRHLLEELTRNGASSQTSLSCNARGARP